MLFHNRFSLVLILCAAVLGTAAPIPAQSPLGGFLPMVGIALTDEFEDSTDPTASATFFIAEPSNSPGGSFLGPGSSAYYDIALLDTGAATHILTHEADQGFNITGEGFGGTHTQIVGGATGQLLLEINDPLGVYAAGLGDRTSAGNSLTMNNNALRGQTSFATLSAPTEWTLPNILGLPMAAHHAISIRNDQPQIFQLEGRTVRTPQVEFHDLGTGGMGITRRTQLELRTGIGFIQGPLYTFDFDFINLNLHDNPTSPSVIPNGGIFVDVDLADGNDSLQDTAFLFDTGADLTVVSEQTAVRLGFDPILDVPDFVLQVEGSGGIADGIPGFYLDELSLDTVGGSFSLTNVPVAVLDVTDPSDPGNVVDGILGTHVFNGRNLVIDANPSLGAGGAGPSLYIGDSVVDPRAWGTTAASGDWVVANNWAASGVPSTLWDATVANVRGSNQEAVLSTNSTIFRATISGDVGAEMSVRVASGGKLTLFADLNIQDHGRLHLDSGDVDAQFIQLDGGSLTGNGSIFVGSGPLTGSVRNVAGRVAPGDPNGDPIGVLDITGDFSNDAGGTLAIDLGGTEIGTYDQIVTDRFAFVAGTLEVNLVDAGGGLFSPMVGNTFTIVTAAEGIVGSFDSLSLPTGFEWDVDYNPLNIVLEVIGLGLVGDFDGNGTLGCEDVDALVAAIVAGDQSATFDVDGSGTVDVGDLDEWILNIKGTLPGDANLDGFVDGEDFIIWNGNKFSELSAWCSGDFNANGFVDGQDFIIWNTHKFQSAGDRVAAVPEPTGCLLCLAGAFLIAGRRRIPFKL